jgi:hypothetical protein
VPAIFRDLGVQVTIRLDEALREADVVNLLRIQHERQRKSLFPSIGEYSRMFGLTQERFRLTKPDIEHPHPTATLRSLLVLEPCKPTTHRSAREVWRHCKGQGEWSGSLPVPR